MKKLFSTKREALGLIYSLLLTFVFFGCSSDDDIPVELKIDYTSSTIELAVSGEQVFNITQGNGGYAVASSDREIATATLDGSKVIIKGVSEGETKVTIIDQKNQKKELAIKVKDIVVDLTVDRESPICRTEFGC